jgi:hypothetical protein
MTQSTSHPKFCSHCGAAAGESEKFCGDCGAALSPVPSEPQTLVSTAQAVQPVPAPARASKRKSVLYNAAASAVVLMVACCIAGALQIAGVVDIRSLWASDSDRSSSDSETTGHQYWKGVEPNSYRLYDGFGHPAAEYSGIPFMVVTYDRTTQVVIDIEFGLSEYTHTALPSASYTRMELPTIADMGDDYQRLGLEGAALLLVSWSARQPGGVSKTMENGVQELSFAYRSLSITPGDNLEEWQFAYTDWDMTGGVKNTDTSHFGGRQSVADAFKLYRQ